MQRHLQVIQEIIEALSEENYESIKQSASEITTSKRSKRMCSKFGAAAPGFVAMGTAFHKTAESIIEAAENKNSIETLKALNNTIQTCNACHAQFRQEIVSKEAWDKLTDISLLKE